LAVGFLAAGTALTWWARPAIQEPRANALSPDGRTLAFVAQSSVARALWVRALDSETARALPGTDGAATPFWSPDGRSLGFFSAGKLRRIDTDGGTPAVLADTPGGGRGGSWNANGVILFNAVNDGPLLKVSAAGGPAMPLTTIDASQHENSHRWPMFLPDGE